MEKTLKILNDQIKRIETELELARKRWDRADDLCQSTYEHSQYITELMIRADTLFKFKDKLLHERKKK